MGTAVGIVMASDPDIDQTLTFSITGGNTNDAFAIDSGSGEISVKMQLDYETISQYNLTVTATDNGSESLSGSATITDATHVDLGTTGIGDLNVGQSTALNGATAQATGWPE